MLFVFPKDVIPNADMVFWLIPFSFILLNGNNNFGPVSRWLNCHGCALWAKLGKLSIYIYLFHFQVIMICKHLPGDPQTSPALFEMIRYTGEYE